ncbi:MAG: hypothetical protein Q7U36_00480 [bacterium]|nr:hypothetical protein [bacterium]
MKKYALRHLSDFTHQLEMEGVIPQDSIDYKWGWVFREILREQKIGYSENPTEAMNLPRTTPLGPTSEKKFEYMAKWAKEQGSLVELPF